MRCVPASPECWNDIEKLFGDKGACGGCWCMYWRLGSAAFEKGRGAANKKALRDIVRSGDEPGVLAYRGEEAIGWCAVSPRQAYVRLATSRVLKPIDDAPVWSITCFFVRKEFRGRGVSVKLLQAAVRLARSHGASIVEGYPVEPGARYADTFAYTGLASAFRKAGFVEVARRSKTRPIMRCVAGKRTRGRSP